jgi:ankyrin repeat protein
MFTFRDEVNKLHQAVWDNDVDEIERLLAIGWDVNCSATFAQGATPLHIAAGYDRYEMAKILLQNGAAPSLNIVAPSGKTPLQLAKNEKMRRLLLSYANNRDNTLYNHFQQPKENLLEQKRDANTEDDRNCKICFEKMINSALDPCGHSLMCYECAIRMAQCPVCRRKIEKALRIFT